MKILIRGGFGLSNFGDDTLLYTLYELLGKERENQQDFSLDILCKNTAYLKKFFPMARVIDTEQILAEEIEKYDILLYGGGTQFYSFPVDYKHKILMVLKNPFKYLVNKFGFYRRRLNRDYIEGKYEIASYFDKIFIVGVGLGPFISETDSTYLKTKSLFQGSTFVSVRDTYAKEICEKWSIPDFSYVPDICYSIPLQNSLSIKERNDSVKKIGFIVRDWNHEEKGALFYEKIPEVIDKVKQKYDAIEFISFDARTDKYWNRWFNGQAVTSKTWNPDEMEITEFLSYLSQFDLIVTARFHGAIFASLLGIPFITIEVEQKLRMIHERFIDSSRCWHSPFNIDELMAHIDWIDNDYSKVLGSLSDVSQRYVESSKNHFIELKKKLFK